MPQEKSLYQDAAQPIAARVDDLLARMTLDEKLAQLGSLWVYELFEGQTYSEAKANTRLQHGMGQITRLGGASNSNPTASAGLANTIQRYLVEQTRLGIPAIVHEETCSGYMAMGATCFPQIIGAACAWEPDLVERMTTVIREQMRAVGGHQSLAPVLDIVRDPRWGRVEETFGEDPYLVSRLGTAYVKGLQGDDLGSGVIGTGKHFLGYGVTEGGMNWAPAHVSERELREIFLPPFETAIKETNLGSIMNAYHEIDGVPLATSRAVFRDLLRDELGFEGIVVSDYFAIDMIGAYHHVAANKTESSVLAMLAGIDVELPSTDCYGDPLRQALGQGTVDMALVDDAVRLILRTKFQLGLFENPYVDAGRAADIFDTGDQRALAREIAQKSMVLLKNDGDLLPLRKDFGSIAVIGPNADSVRNLMGDYSYPAHIESLTEMMRATDNVLGMTTPEAITMVETPVPMVSVLQGIQAAVSSNTQVRYAKGCDILGDSTDGFAEAVEIAQQSDVAILVVGGKSGLTDDCTCGEARDRATLNLTGVQEDLIRAVHATGTPVVVVLINGRPLTFPWLLDHVPAILEAWLPGEEGGNAVADVLFGDANPGGKLVMSFPRAVGQIPTFYNHKPSGGRSHWKEHYVETNVKPQFPFGFGLSYTQFAFGSLKLSTDTARAGDVVDISVEVTNTGDHTGDEVVQLYIHDVLASATRPVKELKGFRRVTLQPGETKTVTFHLSVNQLAFYDRDMVFVVEPGTIEVMVGNSSVNLPCTGSFEIVSDPVDVSAAKVYVCPVSVS
ncbi:MAG: glycoside hydrolase family 3 C-terminal domain-containing protein [Anaerolineae bacterium]|nr:glycoside hydrolase family 3 C-terminal domain-containing protein [Anaerolineae bacterium]